MYARLTAAQIWRKAAVVSEYAASTDAVAIFVRLTKARAFYLKKTSTKTFT